MRSTPAVPHRSRTTIGVVVIARNEGERFRRCLASLEGAGSPIVYVDSGSSDGSVEWARARGCDVVELDTAVPFTAARARNVGLARLLERHPEVALVQFVDGDCEVQPGWLARAARELETHPRRAVVCGRRRERHPERSVYNRIIDVEWDTPVGEARACGGDAMMRVAALLEVGGFDEGLIAGEEPELCVRLRRGGWTVHRVEAEMTLHDADMTRFGQWWRRSVRAGYGYGQGRAKHGRAPERLYVHKTRSVLFSAAAVPSLALGLAPLTAGASLALLAWYPVRVARFARACRRPGRSARDAWTYSAFCMLANAPHLVGLAKHALERLARRPARLIEYKGAPS